LAGIIIEGPDGSGKTTLIRELLHTFQYPTIHVVQPRLPSVLQMIKLIYASPVIFDRFHLSPVVYGKVLRDGPELSKDTVGILEDLLFKHGFVQIICLTRIETMLHNNRKEAQVYETVKLVSVVEKLYEAYLVEAANTRLPTLIYDYLDTPVSGAVKWIKDVMK
jgi:thymidylate kinase